MKFSAAMAANLDMLTAALDDPNMDVAASVRQLILLATAAAPSFIGLKVVMPHGNPPLTVNSLADVSKTQEINTSMQWSLPGPGGSGHALAVVITLYARSPGTFVDLAADLAWLTGRPPTDFSLDQHLPLAPESPHDDHLHPAADINQAIGVLIGRGYTPRQANRLLDTPAAHSRIDRYSAARAVLATIDGEDGR